MTKQSAARQMLPGQSQQPGGCGCHMACTQFALIPMALTRIVAPYCSLSAIAV